MRFRLPWRRSGAEPPGPAVLPIIFMGDSITFSWTGLFERPGLVNRGIPADTTRQVRGRFREQVLLAGAAGVHILAGVNDIAGNGGEITLGETRANLRAMAEVARADGLRVWLASVLPVHGIWWAPAVADPEGKIVELNQGLRADARALGIDYIDYHRALANPAGRLRPEFGADGVHLSSAGYAAITPLALAALGWPAAVDSPGFSV